MPNLPAIQQYLTNQRTVLPAMVYRSSEQIDNKLAILDTG
jgi:hypothetical protein